LGNKVSSSTVRLVKSRVLLQLTAALLSECLNVWLAGCLNGWLLRQRVASSLVQLVALSRLLNVILSKASREDPGSRTPGPTPTHTQQTTQDTQHTHSTRVRQPHNAAYTWWGYYCCRCHCV